MHGQQNIKKKCTCSKFSRKSFIMIMMIISIIISSHIVFLLGISTFVPAVIPTAQASTFRLQYSPY